MRGRWIYYLLAWERKCCPVDLESSMLLGMKSDGGGGGGGWCEGY